LAKTPALKEALKLFEAVRTTVGAPPGLGNTRFERSMALRSCVAPE
jgi:hypothetical protein